MENFTVWNVFATVSGWHHSPQWNWHSRQRWLTAGMCGSFVSLGSSARWQSTKMMREITMMSIIATVRRQALKLPPWDEHVLHCYIKINVYLLLTLVFWVFFLFFFWFVLVSSKAPQQFQCQQVCPRYKLIDTYCLTPWGQHPRVLGLAWGSGYLVSLKSPDESVAQAKTELETLSLIWEQSLKMCRKTSKKELWERKRWKQLCPS